MEARLYSILAIRYMRSNTEPIYKTHTKIESKILRVTTFAIAKLEEQ